MNNSMIFALTVYVILLAGSLLIQYRKRKRDKREDRKRYNK